MNVTITNHALCVGEIEVLGVAASSVLQIGDTDSYTLFSMFDTPPESIFVGPFAPLSLPEESRPQSAEEARIPEECDGHKAAGRFGGSRAGNQAGTP
ncbi:hypothetical protein PACILC2_05120 [Paenibacillus cisolokensis]|uniref:Uncharacterized protein n=1 Tax=Paenibacillus cisolokensis TaxID=1658519 RepID=A0ABQ4N198_9BACL|nr:hypothetical protein [Paenibacillus cisolokensis]GIQ61944.1 hypothetical protein PACILC2_05120 [Paenibacillus cisolokensis]